MARGGLLFDQVGTYELTLLDAAARAPISNTCRISIFAPQAATDMEAYELIRMNSGEYAWFAYLEGGDHLASALAAVTALAQGASSYATIARFLLSCNNSQGYYDFKRNRARPIDLDKAAAYSVCEDSSACDYMRLRNAFMLQRSCAVLGAQGRLPEQANTAAFAAVARQIAKVEAEFGGDPVGKSWLYAHEPDSRQKPCR